ncbi:hypothetical protein ACFXJ8_39340 [Nonomuraea sp. NPDC059194]|uniref:hypothetical protein n=1 Tax=Nonomuraea sp. NPDC059194 TaxID=3346764 RepID=UPI0036B6CA26
MNRPMTKEERRAYNQRRHAEQRQALVADRGPQGLAELWWDQARKIARERAADGDQRVWNDLALWLSNFCDRYGA